MILFLKLLSTGILEEHKYIVKERSVNSDNIEIYYDDSDEEASDEFDKKSSDEQ